jgi:hypothetical protein
LPKQKKEREPQKLYLKQYYPLGKENPESTTNPFKVLEIEL